MSSPEVLDRLIKLTPKPKKRICYRCVAEPFLSALIKDLGFETECSYCEREKATLSVDEVANHVERAFDEHYDRTATEPDGWEYAMNADPEMEYEWERKGEEAKWAIASAADVSEEIANDIRSVLNERHSDFDSATMGMECPFDEDSHYSEKDAGHGKFLELWHVFENGLKTQSRFFSPLAKTILDQIFVGISDLRTTERAPVVVISGPKMPIVTLYRARVFAGEDDALKEALKAPWKHLGTPPAEAAGAGRMNARGIAVFYGARDINTALSEVRPPVGSDVAVASFNIVRPLRLLNLDALRAVAAGGSIFDHATIVQMQKANFLESLSHRMSRPVMPREEASEYLPTQAVADYLANEAQLDGIIFPSIQTGHQSSNVVLFHHAARVEEVELPKGTEVNVQLFTQDSDGIHPDYIVWEKVPPPSPDESQSGAPHRRLGMIRHPHDHAIDIRVPALSIALESVQVHHVEAVEYRTQSNDVTRHRYEQTGDAPWTLESNSATTEVDLDNPFG